VSDPYAPPIPRDRWGRPLIIPSGGGAAIAYTRCTTLASTLDDRYQLEKWQQRMVAIGLAEREDLLLAVVAHKENKEKLNGIVSDALEAAKSHAAATKGTAIHALVDQHDRGELDISRVPAAYRGDIEAYAAATAALEVVAIEQFGVHDEYKLAGTCDRIYRHHGQQYIGDTKTGNIDYSLGTIAMQLAVYAHSEHYNLQTYQRTPRNVDLESALVVHLPVGEGTCRILWVDIAKGWEAVQLALHVRKWRADKVWSVPFTLPVSKGDRALAWLTKVANAQSAEDLTSIWLQADAAGDWDENLLEACKIRKQELSF